MAPRKTKTETTAVETPEQAAQLAGIVAEAARQGAEQVMPLNITNMTVDDLHRIERFEVAKTVISGLLIGGGCLEAVQQHGDENWYGALCRTAFEIADAFIAQSKKGGDDAG